VLHTELLVDFENHTKHSQRRKIYFLKVNAGGTYRNQLRLYLQNFIHSTSKEGRY